MDPTKLRVALVHDWLNGMRGGERVLELLAELFPRSEIFTLLYQPGSSSAFLEDRPIHTSPLGRLPGAKRKHQIYLPFFPFWIEQFDLTGFDLVISTSHCVAKGVLAPPDAPHLCYCFAPMRYAYDQAAHYRKSVRPAFLRPLWDVLLHGLRIWDGVSAARPDLFVGNSHHTANRIRRAYGREAEVVHSPVDLDAFPLSSQEPGDSYLVLSALVPYKRIDLAIEACNRAQKKLVVVGNGPEAKRLKALAGPTIEFRGYVAEEERAGLVAQSRALLFPGEEDFGIVPLEVNAAGRPVVGFGRGGLTETQVSGKTAVFHSEQTVDSLLEAIDELESKSFDPQELRRNAERFSHRAFQDGIRRHVESLFQAFRDKRTRDLGGAA